MADAYLKVKDSGANGLELVRDSSEINAIKRSLAKYAKADLIDLYHNQKKIDTTSYGVTFTWNDDGTECTIVGTCPSDAAVDANETLAENPDLHELPEGFTAGKTYHAKIASTGDEVRLQCLKYVDGSYSSVIFSITAANTPNGVDFTIPNDASSVLIRFAVLRGHTANETVTEATICEV